MQSAISPTPGPAQRVIRIGTGSFGTKMESLAEHSALINRLGFSVPETVVLGWDILTRFQKGMAPQDTERLLAGAHRVLRFPDYVAARSSANGDKTGTGIYFSTLFKYLHASQLAQHICEVGASHYSEEASCFRSELKISEGMGAMLQPIVGTYYDLPPLDRQPSKRVFGPLWSGIVNTQLPQLVVLNPGLLRPETAEGKTMLSGLDTLDPHSTHSALLFDTSVSYTHPVDIGVPGNILLQPAAVEALKDIPAKMLEIKEFLGSDIYAELCVTSAGTVHIVQFAELPPLPKLPTSPDVISGAIATSLCRGACSLHNATALHVTDYIDAEDLLNEIRFFSADLKRRELIVIFEDNILRSLMSHTRSLWGSLSKVGALFSINIQRHSAPFECHLTGAMRMARGFGYGRLHKSPSLGEPQDTIYVKNSRSRLTPIEVYRDCISAEISEGDNVGYLMRSR